MSDTTKDAVPDFGEVAAWRRPNGDLYQENPNGFTDWIPLYEHPVAPAQVQAEAVQWETHLTDVVEHTINTLARQLDLIADRAPGAFLDKIPVVRSLTAHKQRLERALAERNRSLSAPSTSDQS